MSCAALQLCRYINVALQLIRLFQRIFRLDHSQLWLRTYRILPISSDRGARTHTHTHTHTRTRTHTHTHTGARCAHTTVLARVGRAHPDDPERHIPRPAEEDCSTLSAPVRPPARPSQPFVPVCVRVHARVRAWAWACACGDGGASGLSLSLSWSALLP